MAAIVHQIMPTSIRRTTRTRRSRTFLQVLEILAIVGPEGGLHIADVAEERCREAISLINHTLYIVVVRVEICPTLGSLIS